MTQVEINHEKHESIAPATGMGEVHLAVTDAGRALEFYRDVLGLDELPADGGEINLGVGSKTLVVLHPGASAPVLPNTTGLYHLALVVPSRRELARFIAKLFAMRYPNSPTDHVMTKSDYLWDPDGNGIEVYAETPEDGSWFMSDMGFGAMTTDGQVRSGRDPIDLETLFGELGAEDRVEDPLPLETKMGHVHLHVRDVDEAVRFYTGLIGFDVMGISRRFGAAFVSAGGYHHHLGLNIWAGAGASPSPDYAAGLRHFTIEVPTGSDLSKVRERLKAGGAHSLDDSVTDFFVADPSGNRVHLIARSA